MTISLSGSLWLWSLRVVAFLYTILILFHVAVPEILLGLAWLALLIFSFVSIGGASSPPA